MAGLGSPHALAQIPRPESPFERPSEVRPEVPEPGPAQRPQFTLPPLALPESPSLSAGPRITVHEFRVTGSTVRSKHFGKDLLAGLKNLVGGELKGYTELLHEARQEAIERMIEQARTLGANAVVNIRFATSSVAQGAAELFAYGTAVRVE